MPLLWAAGAFLIGALLLSWPLLVTSRLAIKGDEIVMHRSKAFFLVIIVLAAVRYFARDYFDSIMSIQQTAGLFFILAFGIILRWRLRMFPNIAPCLRPLRRAGSECSHKPILACVVQFLIPDP